MRFPDDKDKENKDKYINGAECERKQGNDEGRHCKEEEVEEEEEEEVEET